MSLSSPARGLIPDEKAQLSDSVHWRGSRGSRFLFGGGRASLLRAQGRSTQFKFNPHDFGVKYKGSSDSVTVNAAFSLTK